MEPLLSAGAKPSHYHNIFGRQRLLPLSEKLNLAPVERVVLISESFLPKVDGVSKTSYITAEYLRQTGREVLVIAPDNAIRRLGESEVKRVRSFSIAGAKEMRIGLPSLKAIRYIKAFQPDLVHLATPAMLPLFAALYCYQKRIPMIATYQTDYWSYMEKYGFGYIKHGADRWTRFVHNLCRTNLTPSNVMRETLVGRGYQRFRVWKHGIDLDRFHPEKRSIEMRMRLLGGRSREALLVIYVGRLAPEKCVDMLKDVAQLEGVALTIIGDGDERARLEKHFAGTDVHFTGYLYGDELASAYASSDLFLASGPHETFGLVIQEAMAAGLPVVVTDRGGGKDLVVDGQTGCVVSHTPSAFADAVEKLRVKTGLRLSMGKAARADTEQRPWWRIMQQMEKHYAAALRMPMR